METVCLLLRRNTIEDYHNIITCIYQILNITEKIMVIRISKVSFIFLTWTLLTFKDIHGYSIGKNEETEDLSHRIEKRETASIWEFPEKVGTGEVDLVVILDRSLGIGQDWFYVKELKVVYALIQQFAFIHKDFLRIAVLSFAKDWSVDYDGISNIEDAVNKCQFFNHPGIWKNLTFIKDEEISAGTNIKGALEGTKDILIKGNKNRPGAQQVSKKKL